MSLGIGYRAGGRLRRELGSRTIETRLRTQRWRPKDQTVFLCRLEVGGHECRMLFRWNSEWCGRRAVEHGTKGNSMLRSSMKVRALNYRVSALRLIAFGGVVWSLAMGGGRCASGESSGNQVWERLLREVPECEERLERWASQLTGAFQVEVNHTGISIPQSRDVYRFAVNGMLVKTVFSVGDGKEVVQAANSKYSFSLTKPKGEADFSVTFLEPGTGGDRLTQDRIKDIVEDMKSDVCAAWYLLGQPLREWVQDSRFHMTEAVAKATGGKELVQVRFKWLPRREDDPLTRIDSASFVVAPAALWTIQEYHVERQRGTIDAELEYDEGFEETPILMQKRQVVKAKPDDGVVMTRVVKYDVFERRLVPEDEFTLSAYGLPEPTFGGPTSSMWNWFLLGAGAFGAASYLLRRRVLSPRSSLPTAASESDGA